MKNLFMVLALLSIAAVWLSVVSLCREENPNWQAHAGLVAPYTDAEQVSVSASSGGTASVVLDNNIQTFWQSDAPYPTGYIRRADQNILLDQADMGNCIASSRENLSILTDGNLDSSIKILSENGAATVTAHFAQATPLYALSIKAATEQSLSIQAIDKNGKTFFIANYEAGDSYQLRRYVPQTALNNIVRLEISTTQSYTLFEIAALAAPPLEYITIKLPQAQTIGWVDSRHYTADQCAMYGEIQLSNDGKQFKTVARLNPNAIPLVPNWISPPQTAQYIRIAQAVNNKDWAKVSIWEIDAYNEQGPYGNAPAAQAQQYPLNDILGINGIWGWGNKQGSVGLGDNKGAKLYAKVASHARNYHEMDWDISDPDHIPNYAAMTRGQGTETQPWLDWNAEYGEWKKAGLRLDISVKFERNEIHKPINWDNPQKAAYQYGYAMARHFGPTYGNGLAETIEVGNEPWDYTPQFYRTILKGMASGIKAADPALTVLPCALQAGYAQAEQSDFKNYAGLRLTADEAPYIDAYNCHHYSYLTDSLGEQRGIYPEHPQSSMRYVLNDLRFCRQNMPDKKIFVTEWGWDSEGAGENCTHSQCVSELAQAIYGIRGALWFTRLGIDRLMWYFYANGTGGSIIYNRSGLTGSVETNFAPKRAFRAFEALRHLVGEQYFLSVLREDAAVYAYVFGNKQGKATHLVVWRPVAADDTQSKNIALSLPYRATQAWRIDGSSSEGEAIDLPKQNASNITLSVSAIPMVVLLE
jgi:hypothetical protein